jgi:hypothetical protein
VVSHCHGLHRLTVHACRTTTDLLSRRTSCYWLSTANKGSRVGRRRIGRWILIGCWEVSEARVRWRLTTDQKLQSLGQRHRRSSRQQKQRKRRTRPTTKINQSSLSYRGNTIQLDSFHPSALVSKHQRRYSRFKRMVPWCVEMPNKRLSKLHGVLVRPVSF